MSGTTYEEKRREIERMALTATISWVLLGLLTPQASPQDIKRDDVPDARISLAERLTGPLAFSKDGKYLAVMLDEKADISLIHLPTRKQVRIISGLKRPPQPPQKWPEFAIPRLAFSPDSKVLVGRLEVLLDRRGEGFLPVWDVETGKRIARLSAFDYQTYSIEFSSDGKTFLASSTNLGTGYDHKTGVKVWEWPPKYKGFPLEARRFFDSPSANYSNVLFAPGDKTFISMIEEEYFEIHDLETGKLVEAVKTDADKRGGQERWSAFSPDGKLLAVAADRAGAVSSGEPMPGVLNIWDFGKKSLRRSMPQPYLSLYVSFSPEGKRVAVTSRSGTGVGLVNIYDVESGHLERSLQGDFRQASFTPDGQWLVDIDDTDIVLWKTQ